MTQSNVKPIPDDMHSVTPHLICEGAAAAIDWNAPGCQGPAAN